MKILERISWTDSREIAFYPPDGSEVASTLECHPQMAADENNRTRILYITYIRIYIILYNFIIGQIETLSLFNEEQNDLLGGNVLRGSKSIM